MNCPSSSVSPMTAERYQLIGRIFAEVCSLGVEERSAVLLQLCGHDAELLRQIENLLDPEQQAEAENFLFGGTGELLSLAAAWPTIPRFELLEVAGRGGMGTVYRARQIELPRIVALKVLPLSPLLHPTLQERFRREARAMARLKHLNIVPVYEVQFCTAGLVLCMEWCPGGTLADRLKKEKTLTPQQVAELLLHLANAIAHAHREGVIHRDLKPSNILFDAEGRGKIADFGSAIHSEDERLTGSLACVTPHYAAPEQLREPSELPNPLSDVHALGAILYECLSGKPPFQGDDSWTVMERVLHDEPLPLRRRTRAVPRDLETICMKCLRKEPAARYQSAEALAEDLRRYLSGEPILARPTARWQQLRRWVQRYPWAASFMLLLLISLGVMAWLWRANAESLRLALEHAAAAAVAHQDREVAISGSRQMALTLSELAPPPTTALPMPDRVQVMRVQEKVAESCRTLLRRDPNDRVLRTLLARMTASLGTAHYTQDQFPDALKDLEEARELWSGLREDDEANLDYHRQLVAVLGILYHVAAHEQLPTTLDLGRQLLAAQERLTVRAPEVEAQYDTSSVRALLARRLISSGSHEEARTLLERNLALLAKLPPLRDVSRQAVGGQTWMTLAESHTAAGRNEDAHRCLTRACEEFHKLPEGDLKYSLVATVALQLCREVGPNRHRHAREALAAAEQLATLAKADLQREPANASQLLRLVHAQDSEGKAHEILGQLLPAIEAHREAAAALRRMGNRRLEAEDSGPEDRHRFREFVERLLHVAELQESAGLADDCRTTRERLTNALRIRLEELLARSDRDEESAEALADLSSLARLARRPEMALRAAEASRDRSLRLIAATPERLSYHRHLADAHALICKSCLQLERQNDGLKAAQAAVAAAQFLYRREPSAHHARFVQTHSQRLAQLLRELGAEQE